MNLMVTTKQKPITDRQKSTEKGTQTNHQRNSLVYMRREQEKKGTEETYKNNQKTMNKMAMSTYLVIITLNSNVMNTPIKYIVWLNG